MRLKSGSLFFFVLVLSACSKPLFQSSWIKETGPANFTARFESTRGNFDIEVIREWSPLGADRFYQLVKHRLFDNTIIYRAVPGYVVQFGNTDSVKIIQWEKNPIPDEPVIEGNLKMNVGFARSGKNSRKSQIFINLNNNQRLDTLQYNNSRGFPAFGRIVAGAAIVEKIYTGYGNESMKKWDLLYSNRKGFLDSFPLLDQISKAYLLKK